MDRTQLTTDELYIIFNATRADGRFIKFRYWKIGSSTKGQMYDKGYWLGNTYEFVLKNGKLVKIIG